MRLKPNLLVSENDILNKNINDTKKQYPNLQIRAIIEDGIKKMHTMDFRPERINVEVENKIIKKIISYG